MRRVDVTNALLDKWGGPNQIPLVEAKCENDEWENAIRRMGVANACEWMGHCCHDDFTIGTIIHLLEKSGVEI